VQTVSRYDCVKAPVPLTLNIDKSLNGFEENRETQRQQEDGVTECCQDFGTSVTYVPNISEMSLRSDRGHRNSPYEWLALDGLEASFRACQEINSEMMSLPSTLL
jgi:hypothetical protein